MNTLEIIHLRLGENSRHGLIEVIRESIDSGNGSGEARIYRHARLGTDLAVHLCREASGKGDHASKLGVRMASALREYGIVEHSVWVEEDEEDGASRAT